MGEEVLRMFRWTEALSVGCEEIDQEHRTLFDLAERLHRAMLDGQGRQVLERCLGELSAYTLSHFAHEESLMRRRSYSGLPAHAEEHQSFRLRVQSLNERLRIGETTMTMEALQMMAEWLTQHVSVSDRKIGVSLGDTADRPS